MAEDGWYEKLAQFGFWRGKRRREEGRRRIDRDGMGEGGIEIMRIFGKKKDVESRG